MRASVLIVKLAGGGLEAVAREASAEVLKIARDVRVTGKLGKAAVECGTVLSTSQSGPLKSFRVAKSAK